MRTGEMSSKQLKGGREGRKRSMSDETEPPLGPILIKKRMRLWEGTTTPGTSIPLHFHPTVAPPSPKRPVTPTDEKEDEDDDVVFLFQRHPQNTTSNKTPASKRSTNEKEKTDHSEERKAPEANRSLKIINKYEAADALLQLGRISE